VQIQCAQCHDHKTEKWTRGDFRKFAACFDRIKPKLVGEPKMGRRTFEVRDMDRPRYQGAMGMDFAEYALAPPHALDGTDLSKTDNPRQALAHWIVSPENPWFAR